MTIFISNSGRFLKMFLISFALGSLLACASLSEADKVTYNETLQRAGRGDTEKAIEMYQSLLEKNPNYDKARYNLALLLVKEKKWGEAKVELAILEAKMPRNTRVLKLKAYALFGEGQEAEALELYGELVLRLPTDREILYNLAYLSWQVNQDAKEATLYLRRLESSERGFNLSDKEWVKEMGYESAF